MKEISEMEHRERSFIVQTFSFYLYNEFLSGKKSRAGRIKPNTVNAGFPLFRCVHASL